MSSKVVFLTYLPFLQSAGEFNLRAAIACSTAQKTAVVLTRKGKSLCIEGYPEVSFKEKHKCWTLFQHAVKQLLGVPEDKTVCFRFSEAPFNTVGSLTDILQEANYIIDLFVSPVLSACLPNTSPNVFPQYYCNTNYSLQSQRDAYCKYRERFHKKRPLSVSEVSRETWVRQKCNFPEMAKLLSQLEEVSLSLERTQNHIALRCGQLNKTKGSNARARNVVDVPQFISNSRTDFSSLGLECLNRVDGSSNKELFTPEDVEVEQMLQVAESLILKCTRTREPFKDNTESLDSLHESHCPPPKSHDTLTGSCDHICTDDCAAITQLPDRPTDVVVRPSFTDGGIYIMWNPVRLDAHSMNNGHTVLGYIVYFDKRLSANINGPLSSQVEVFKDLEVGKEYLVQVCTRTNHCNSLLSCAVNYRHSTAIVTPESSKESVSVKQEERKSKEARVQSWLLNGHISPTSHSLAQGVDVKLSGKTVISGEREQYPARPDHHVHFAPLTTSSEDDLQQWASQQQHHFDVTEAGTQMTDSGCDDTRSTGSSHTSGIVTDYPMSPNLRQSSACECHHCGRANSVTRSLTQDSDVLLSNLHLYSDDGFHAMPHCTCHEESNSVLGSNSKSTISSTLCHSIHFSRASSTDKTCSVSDTIIDEMVDVHPSMSIGSQTSLSTCSPKAKGHSNIRSFYRTSRNKGPEPPTNISVHFEKMGEHNILLLEWKPVRRDKKGCSNDLFVLGYRIYINDALQESVDGALTCQAKIYCPPLQYIKLDIRSRAMAGESPPSTPVILSLLAHCRLVEGSTVVESHKTELETYV